MKKRLFLSLPLLLPLPGGRLYARAAAGDVAADSIANAGPASVPDPDALTRSLHRLHAASSLPGFAVAIVGHGQVLYQRGFGYANVRRKSAYTESTLQNVGSVSKTVVGVALVKAIELGYFTLDTEIATLLPFALYTPPGAGPITLKHLVTHTSGIVDDDDVYGHSYFITPQADQSSALYGQFKRDFTSAGRPDLPPGDLSLGQFLRHYLAGDGRFFKKSNFGAAAPGSAYAYSNIGAALAAFLVEQKSGQDFRAFTVQHIFAPLGMRDTGWGIEPDNAGATKRQATRQATPYNRKRQAYPHYGLVTYPDGGLTTSAADLARYLVAMMQGYAGRAGILSPEGFRLLFAPQFDEATLPAGSPANEPNGGIFWRIKPNGQIGHTGSDPGITAFLFFDPATGRGKLLMSNTEFEGAVEAEERRVSAQFLAIWRALDQF